ncbi:uncharacterized protein [Drosophila virilis]|uniref:CCHC-type domain-containing protein n=1 Tax=Drosophila virilis TaxID=7244 RepID=A0A0Q9VZC5_DROVI|nr:uncharacterized protein Dvir_GJ25757 [Drosophila virilis]
MSQVEIRDLDELATKEEVVEAVKNALNDDSLLIESIKSLRPAFGGQQRATITLPAPTARTLVEKANVRIGWVVCRIRAIDQPKRCFEYQGFGYIAANCTSGDELKGACFRCGDIGHVAKSCSKQQQCSLCTQKGEIYGPRYRQL